MKEDVLKRVWTCDNCGHSVMETVTKDSNDTPPLGWFTVKTPWSDYIEKHFHDLVCFYMNVTERFSTEYHLERGEKRR